MERLIFHVDVNSAFLSWEAARRVKNGEDDLRLVPSAIGGDREKRTGVILAKSVPAKRYGVTTGEPVGMALRKCPSLILARPDFTLYRESSRAFMAICRRYTPAAEQYSIDECFLDMTGSGYLFPDPVKTAFELKEAVKNELGFTVNVGVGSNKLLAKTAGDFEKPDKVHTLFSEEIESKLWPLPVGDLLYVGKMSAEKLNRAGIYSVKDAANVPLSVLQSVLGSKFGLQVHEYAWGIDPSPVRTEPEDAKGYSISTTLETDVTSEETARQVLLALTDSVAERMRRDGARCRCVGVTVRDTAFKNTSHQKKLSAATDVTGVIQQEVRRLFLQLWDGKTPLRLLGVSLTDVVREGWEQLSLIPDEKQEKARRLDQALDGIRQKYGTDVIRRGSTMEEQQLVGRKYKTELKQTGKEDRDPHA